MPTKTRETWRDWMAPDAPEPEVLFTREEIAEHASGVDPVGPNDIRYWEYQGVLPRSIRKWRDGAPRALYPGWYATLARSVRNLQRTGLTLEEIGPRIRQQAAQIEAGLLIDWQLDPSPALIEAANDYARALLRDPRGDQLFTPAKIELYITLPDGSGWPVTIPIEGASETKKSG